MVGTASGLGTAGGLGAVEAFAEAVRSIGQPCSLVVILPPVCAVLAGRGRRPVVAGALVGGVVGGWLFAGGRLVLGDVGIRLSAALVLLAIALIAFASRTRRGTPLRRPAVGAVGAVAAGVVAATAVLWWRPCVGAALGRILTDFPDDPAGQALPMAAFVLGLLLPVPVTAILLGLLDRRSPLVDAAGLVGAVAASLLALAVLGGAHDDLVSQLVRWTV